MNLINILEKNRDILPELVKIGVLNDEDSTRTYNVGKSNYSSHVIQPWSIWKDYNLNPWDADIVKRILRTKEEPGISLETSRKMDYEKIIHICKERLRQIDAETPKANGMIV